MPWDPPSTVTDYYMVNFQKLDAFFREGKGELLDIARCIRPLLEENLRIRFPREVTSDQKMLGEIIRTIRDASPASSIARLKGKIDSLERLNDYSKQFMHSGASSQIDRAELRSHVQSVIDLTSG